ncbi:putative transporter svop-1 [Pectinophora gossypiella]|uniref:putative transporter svop-1 n=1 Tax=Pectinophora gossypiella TaxID=13191 RepID=UPI00214F3CEA|nr:putative transporter svop-1 [Pectinophora gossypiella]XP_049870533.1 putative transporter svop-1 [Pectinophora gossypiella]
MVAIMDKQTTRSKCSYDEALDCTGFGRYNLLMLTSCSLLILAMYLDVFGLSVALPAIACDLELTTSQQGLLSAVPLIGVMISSYGWGLCADTRGRRWTLLVAMPIGAILNIAVSIAPNYAALASLKFLSACFTSSANAAAFVLMGESSPLRHRSRFMFLMASATMFVQFVISICALPIFQLTFRIPISWLALDLRPWRLLLLVISVPGILGILSMLLLHESPKYLFSKSRDEEAMEILRGIYGFNTGEETDCFPVKSVTIEESPQQPERFSLRQMWNQTAPLFRPPLLKNSLKLYYILLCAFMTSTGFTMWVPTMTNAFFNGDDTSGKTFCEVASTAAQGSNSTSTDCNGVVTPSTLYAVMCYSGVAGILTIIISFLVGIVGKRRMMFIVFTISASCGILLLFVRIPILSIALFNTFLYVSFILGNINTYLVELNPTHLRGMATCLSVVAARGFGFFSVQLIATLLADHCLPMMSGYIVLVISGLIVSLFLPPDDVKKTEAVTAADCEANTDKTRF